MKPLPSERQLLVGGGGVLGGQWMVHPQGSVLLEERR